MVLLQGDGVDCLESFEKSMTPSGIDKYNRDRAVHDVLAWLKVCDMPCLARLVLDIVYKAWNYVREMERKGRRIRFTNI